MNQAYSSRMRLHQICTKGLSIHASVNQMERVGMRVKETLIKLYWDAGPGRSNGKG